ncbi:hypothetical protein LC653_19595 [Nostoc sp. CHAB 5784]|uniref:hypothetical protein n=1 Tax=Nostoc mirabile TaxID=2907820 RepID=UPI001E38FCD9|nr:hypothetical protein [Nostoc mirabile]MCC5666064.1 hypothetical protein [Nostoc mirabile CHAB5784]
MDWKPLTVSGFSLSISGLTQTIAETLFHVGAIHELPLQRVLLRKSYICRNHFSNWYYYLRLNTSKLRSQLGNLKPLELRSQHLLFRFIVNKRV